MKKTSSHFTARVEIEQQISFFSFGFARVSEVRHIQVRAGRQEVSRCCTRGESGGSIARRRGIHPGFETLSRQVQNRGISDITKGLMSSKKLKIKYHFSKISKLTV